MNLKAILTTFTEKLNQRTNINIQCSMDDELTGSKHVVEEMIE
jgi:hypothetical protein